MFKYNTDFYPTPEILADKMVELLDFNKLNNILEPSAGKGDLVAAIIRRGKRLFKEGSIDIDCIEIDGNLRNLLIGAGCRVVHDNFMTFLSFKHYDAIIMNPPFSAGASHLLKALELMRDGGQIICLLNAETIKNPYTNTRKDLLDKLDKLQASIIFEQGLFIGAERPTGVEVAIVSVKIPKQDTRCSLILDNLKKAEKVDVSLKANNKITSYEYVQRMVECYNFEARMGMQLISEYESLKPYLMSDLKVENYTRPLLDVTINGKDYSYTAEEKINVFLKGLRYKYWMGLSNSGQLQRMMTSNLQHLYQERLHELRDYDFTMFNVEMVSKMLSDNMVNAIDETIVKLFDKLSAENAWYCGSKNIHYYNGWATNKAHKINNKVIIWADAYDNIFRTLRIDRYGVSEILRDIEKTLNYIDMGHTGDYPDIVDILNQAEACKNYKNIRAKYFTMTFYKKGTCHLSFHSPELIKKLNIFASKKKGWLPPSYGHKSYRDMNDVEKKVIDEFEGEIGYSDTLNNKDFYLPDKHINLLQA